MLKTTKKFKKCKEYLLYRTKKKKRTFSSVKSEKG